MTQKPGCAEGERLIAFLYDEADAGARARMAAHLATCASCRAELDALAATRQELAAWAPPDVALDFQLPASAGTGPLLEGTGGAAPDGASGAPAAPRRWWTQPLPAWAQMAAALAIFVAGLAAGSFRERPPADIATLVATPRAVDRPEVSALETRLRALEARALPAAAMLPMDEATRAAIVRQVRMDLEQGQPWNPAVREVLLTMTNQFQSDLERFERKHFGFEPAGPALTATALGQ